MSVDPPADREGPLLLALIRLGVLIRRLLDKEFVDSELRVNATESGVLHRLLEQPHLPSARLADDFGMRRQSMRELLQKLSARELVELRRLGRSEALLGRATEAGRVELAFALQVAARLERRLLSGADDPAREQLLHFIETLLRFARSHAWDSPLYRGLL